MGLSGVEVYVPEITVVRRGHKGMEPLFPSYVFVRTDPQSGEWPRVRWARDIQYFLPAQMQPLSLSETLVEGIRSQVEHWNEGGWVDALKPGDRVVIGAGALRTLDAIFQRYVSGRERCEVLVSLMGRQQRVEVELTGIETPRWGRRFVEQGA